MPFGEPFHLISKSSTACQSEHSVEMKSYFLPHTFKVCGSHQIFSMTRHRLWETVRERLSVLLTIFPPPHIGNISFQQKPISAGLIRVGMKIADMLLENLLLRRILVDLLKSKSSFFIFFHHFCLFKVNFTPLT